MKNLVPGAVTLSILFLSPLSAGDDITSAALGLCEKFKECAMAKINQEDLTPEVRQMMEPMMASMCTNMQSKVESVPSGHPMYDPAVTCMRSMQAMECEAMEDPQRFETHECKKYEELVRASQGTQ